MNYGIKTLKINGRGEPDLWLRIPVENLKPDLRSTSMVKSHHPVISLLEYL